ncbi:hypothetical protein SALWKB12_1392 [Snodgrassella communis]|uniref:Uncharacterized protein n=1 Tax=Snodgrassella communis TaxID=2946699 RepID=A0A836MRX6_9NEIS|nr:hypothetical protein SALWKB12_1392 [Snodgrassella communis]KDN14957.1 hypothetical protein SALWKB29_1029 [Snodgrassella communis]
MLGLTGSINRIVFLIYTKKLFFTYKSAFYSLSSCTLVAV